MLKAKTEEQKEHIDTLLGNVSFVYDYSSEGLHIDDYISFDEMASVVDYLRQEGSKRRQKARRAALKSCVGGVEFDSKSGTLKAPVNDVERFIKSLGALGYDINELMKEYEQTGKITI